MTCMVNDRDKKKNRPAAAAIVVFAVILTVTGCGISDTDLKARVDQLIEPSANQTPRQVQQNYQALLILDQEYPDRLVLKATLGQIQLQNGNLDLAAAYLKRGEKIVGPFADADVRYRLYHALAVLSLLKGEHERAINYADKLKGLRDDGEFTALLLQARAKVELKRDEEAIADYASVYEKKREVFGLEDYTKYIQALVNKEKYPDAIRVFQARQKRFGYAIGHGMDESALNEKVGKLPESVLGAFIELEMRRAALGTDAAQLRTNLDSIGQRISESGLDTDGKAAAVLKGLRLFVDSRWLDVADAFKDEDLANAHPVLAYVVLASKLRGEGAQQADFQAYDNLEPYFRAMQPYYDHLWRSWRRHAPGYSFTAAQPVLETTIAIDPRTGLADDARKELARLLGLRPDDGNRLLLESEQSVLVYALAQYNDAAALDPLLELLALPDNPYGISATNYLREAVRSPRVRAMLESRRKAAEGRLKERLVAILGG